jgi:hypothetical protein
MPFTSSVHLEGGMRASGSHTTHLEVAQFAADHTATAFDAVTTFDDSTPLTVS